jgi:hypothetical protein
LVFAGSRLWVRGSGRHAGAIDSLDRRFEYRSQRGVAGSDGSGSDADNFADVAALPR